ncbi:hypothetical protein QBC43DRAFT_313934 [Cladorrhinum sp. PSN259]|nr:hypothetical protein QBC43DRAFT_313934 [Cladorrhinum sp. PSN259]
MLGLGSMAAQLQGCHCRACFRPSKVKNFLARRRLTTTTATAKRATGTSAANPRRRKALASDVFTACYTAIMATAAVIDAGRKDERRRSLDRKIEQARQHLEKLVNQQGKGRDQGDSDKCLVPGPFKSQEQTTMEVLENITKVRPGLLLAWGERQVEKKEDMQRLRQEMFPRWTFTPSPPTGRVTLNTVTEALLAEEAEGRGALVPGREPCTEVQMERMTAMVNALVDSLLLVAYNISEAETPGTNFPPGNLNSAHTLIRLLRSDGYPRYTFPEHRPEDAIRARSQMDDLNKKIMVNFVPQLRVKLVAKMCYNLLVCEFPPSIQNYNTLIWGLTELGEHELAWVVVESFLHHSHLHPTPGTALCLLQHFRLKRDVVGFFEIIRRLTGQDPRGLGLGRKKQDDGWGARSLILRVGSADNVASTEGWYVQRMEITQAMVDTITEGLLDFGQTLRAAKVLISALYQGWVINEDLFSRLLHDCIELLDPVAASTIVEGLLTNIDKATTLIDQVNIAVVRKIRRILAIWHVKSTFTIEDRLAYSGLLGPPQKIFDQLTTALWLRENISSTNVVNHALERAKSALENRDNPLVLRLDLATTILDHATKQQIADLERPLETMWLAKIDWFQDTVDETEALIINAEFMICHAITKTATPTGMRTWMHFQKRMPVADRLRYHKEAMTPGTWLHAVAGCFVAKRELDFELKCILMQALPDEWVDTLWNMRNCHDELSLNATMIYTTRWLKKLRGLPWQGKRAYWEGKIGYGQMLAGNNESDEVMAEIKSKIAGGVAAVVRESMFPSLPEPLKYKEDMEEMQELKEGEKVSDEKKMKEKKNKNKKRKKGEKQSDLDFVMNPDAFKAQMMAGFAVASGADESGR